MKKRRSKRSAACDRRKSGIATFSRKFRCALRLGCPLMADNSTLALRKVFSATHMSRQKTDYIDFTPAGVKLCEAFELFCRWRQQNALLAIFH